eukprot:TRINITY_DN2653_c0_g3_i1.p1 TRINITY_DN2653_c0_g3~~TRINITY_DN2653_c0_g3_i1.p1  ORF type:complete len:120 (+),score=29.08 TRINITY_DN2653_c0_g3_i1:181-540(+)
MKNVIWNTSGCFDEQGESSPTSPSSSFWDTNVLSQILKLNELDKIDETGLNMKQKHQISMFLVKYIKHEFWGWGTMNAEQQKELATNIVKNVRKSFELEAPQQNKLMDEIRVLYEFTDE